MDGLNFHCSEAEAQAMLKVLNEAKKERFESIQAKQVREIVPIEKWLEDPYYVGPDGARIYDYWKEAIKKVYAPNSNISEVIITGCFSADTLIKTKEGFKEISLVTTCDSVATLVGDEIIYTNPVWAGKTGVLRETYLATIDGFSFRVTPNHKFLMPDLEYKAIKDIPVNSTLYGGKVLSHYEFYGYEDVYDMEVMPNHNYLLANGTVVHNSIGTG